MASFIAMSGLLLALALAVGLWPLFRQSRGTALLLALLVPAAVAGLYAYKGRPEAITAVPTSRTTQAEQMQQELLQRLASEPADLEAWVLLGRSRAGGQDYAGAAEAFAQARALAPDEPELMVEYAEAQMRASDNRRFPPAAVALLEKAIRLQPENQRGLFFLGMHRLQSGDATGAAGTWEQLLPLVDEKTAAALLPQINAARDQAQQPPLAMPAPGPGLAVTITITMAASLANHVPADAVLFVYARNVAGSGPPVAARRIEAPRFPLQITLSDADSVMPTQKLSAQAQVQIAARLSASGSATPGTGDIEAEALLVEVKPAASAELSLSEIRP